MVKEQELWTQGHTGGGGDCADALDLGESLGFLPERCFFLERGADGGLEFFNLSVEQFESRPGQAAGELESMPAALLKDDGAFLDQLLTRGDQLGQGELSATGDGIGLWRHLLAKAGENGGIDGIGFSQAPQAASEIAHLARINHRDRDLRSMGRSHQGAFITAAGFAHQVSIFGQTRQKAALTLGIIGKGSFGRGAVKIECCFGDIDTEIGF